MKKVYVLILVCMSIKVGAQTSTFSRTDSLLERGRYRLALSDLKAMDTLQDISNYKIGSIYASIDNHKKAIEFYEKSIVLKDTYKAKLMLGKSYYKLKNYIKAIEIYQKLIDEDPNNLLLSYQLGKLFLIKNNLDASERIFKNLATLDPENPEYNYQLGVVSSIRKDGNGMLINFLTAYQKDSTHIKSVFQLAKTYTLLKVKDSAKLFINKGLQLDSLHINLNRLKINELFRVKNYKEAIGLLHKIDTIEPNELYTQKMLGRSYFNIEQYDNAEKSFNKAKILDNEDFKIYKHLGHIEKVRKNYRKAMLNYFRATTVGKKPRNEEYYSLGLLYLEMKQLKLAIEMFKKSIKESNRFYKVLYQLAISSDSYYKDKKISYEHYKNYLNMFEHTDKEITAFVKNRVKEIKKELFLKGENVE